MKGFAMIDRVAQFATRRFADVPANIEDEHIIRKVDFVKMKYVESIGDGLLDHLATMMRGILASPN